ncbi:MAG: 2-succinyl-5-enolpyruvyl-6-hydroxy-3-cyclohexene-1-carboxylate synthase, partial [Nocardioides sp.]
SADRPPELRGTGANQTTVQPGMFGAAVRWSHELGTPERRVGQQAQWRAVVSRAVAAATGASGDCGPVHLNVPLREPLVPTDEGDWPESLEGRPDGDPWTRVPTRRASGRVSVSGPEPVARTLVVIGDLPSPDLFRRAVGWAVAHGWPVVAEPFGDHPRPDVVPHGPLLLTATDWLKSHAPDRVVTVGRVTLSRSTAAVVRREGIRVETVSATSTWSDPSGLSAAVHDVSVLDVRPGPGETVDQPWLAAWLEAGRAIAKALADEAAPWPSGLAVARTVLGWVPARSTVFVGSSNAARDLDLAAGGPPSTDDNASDVFVVASRGLAGIDGCVSTAAGLALAGGRPAYALMGDLTFLHDTNGLLVGPHEPQPDLTVVVTNDDGGGIFTLLEPGEPERAADFERVFGTPTGTDLAALCAAHGVTHRLVRTDEDLRDELSRRPSGLKVVEVPVARSDHRAVHARLRQSARDALRRLE